MNVFDKISEKSQEKILKILRGYEINILKDKKIVDYFNDDDEIGIILEGRIQVIQNNYNGTKTVVDDLGENNLIGCKFTYLKNNEYEIVAKENSKLIIISYNEIKNTADTTDKNLNLFIRNLLFITNEILESKIERIEILTQKSIRSKLLEYFNVNSKKNGSRYIYLPFNFSDLATYLAVDRSAMTRELSYLKEEGFIAVKGKRITLLYR